MKISVIIPVYNAEKFILNAVQSALQFDEVHEVILIEDESSDNSLVICEKLAKQDVRVKLFQHPKRINQGAGLSRNLGIIKAMGDYISFLDADNYYLPNRFDAEKELLQYPEVDGVYGASGIHYYSQEARDQYFHIYKDNLVPGCKKYHPKSFISGQLNQVQLFDHFKVDAVTVKRDRLFEKMSTFFKPFFMQEDVEFSVRISYYMNLFYGIIKEPIVMKGICENMKTELKNRKYTVSPIIKTEHQKILLNYFIHLQSLRLLVDK